MKVLTWIFRLLMFFVLLAFALQNQHHAIIKWPFGYQWESQTVFIVLASFALGCAVGVIAMLPGWWRHKAAARSTSPAITQALPTTPPERAPEHPPRDGL